MAEREKAISSSLPNPTVAVEKTSLEEVPVSLDDATATTPSHDISNEAPAAHSKKDDKEKGKKVVPSMSRG